MVSIQLLYTKNATWCVQNHAPHAIQTLKIDLTNLTGNINFLLCINILTRLLSVICTLENASANFCVRNNKRYSLSVNLTHTQKYSQTHPVMKSPYEIYFILCEYHTCTMYNIHVSTYYIVLFRCFRTLFISWNSVLKYWFLSKWNEIMNMYCTKNKGQVNARIENKIMHNYRTWTCLHCYWYMRKRMRLKFINLIIHINHSNCCQDSFLRRDFCRYTNRVTNNKPIFFSRCFAQHMAESV